MNDWLNVGINGLTLLKRKESFSPVWYLCPAKRWTIGWGHVRQTGDNFDKIDIQKGEELLRLDCKNATDAIKKWVTYELNQNQFDALTSLIFNIGVGAFRRSTLLLMLNKGHLTSAADQFMAWNKITVNERLQVSKGLTIRRAEERALFLMVNQ